MCLIIKKLKRWWKQIIKLTIEILKFKDNMLFNKFLLKTYLLQNILDVRNCYFLLIKALALMQASFF